MQAYEQKKHNCQRISHKKLAAGGYPTASIIMNIYPTGMYILPDNLLYHSTTRPIMS